MMGSRMLCTTCGSETTTPLRVPPGSPWVALALGFAFVLPGVVYTVWRYTSKKTVCPTCGHEALIPSSAPLARTWMSAGWLPQRVDTGRTPIPADARLERIEQAIDAIAIEVERVGEAQRLSARLLSERSPADRSSVRPQTPS